MPKHINDITIALAGIYQAAHLVQRIAHRGHEISPAVRASIHSLFKLDAADTADVFGGLTGVATGLSVLAEQFGASGRHQRDLELTRYVISLIALERKLSRDRLQLKELRSGIEAAAVQADYFSETHANVLARLADIYRNTISTLTPRIMVSGESAILSNPDNASLIRTLLLAGIRATVLWRQCGGNRMALVLRRNTILQACNRLAARLPSPRATGDNSDISV